MPEILIVPISFCVAVIVLIVVFLTRRRKIFAEIEQTSKYIDELFNNNDLCSIIEKQTSNIAIRHILSETIFLPMNTVNILNITKSKKFNDLFTNVSNSQNNYLYLLKSLDSITLNYLEADLKFSLRIKEQIGETYNLDKVKSIGMFTAQFASDDCKELFKIFELYDFLQKQNVIKSTSESTYFFAFLYIIYYYKLIKICNLVNNEIKNLGVSTDISVEEFIKNLYNLHALDTDNILSYCLLSLYYQNNYKLTFSRIACENREKIKLLIQQCLDKDKLEKLRKGNYNSRRYSMLEIDSMNGQEFEDFVAELFNNLGYQAERTKLSGDQGVDVIAKKGGQTLAIQAKHYNQSVGNHAIMEVVGGAKIYNATLCYVVTNNYFTKSAKELANAHNVILWDRDKLIEKLSEI